jgi:hypothetical protein
MRDRTSPPPPVVTTCAYSTALDRLSASWVCVDPESAITEYQYAIGTTQGGADVVPWTSVGTNTSVEHTGLSLTTGSTYYFSVKAKNTEALWGDPGNSDGITAVPSISLNGVHNNPYNTSVIIPCAIVTVGTDQFSSSFYVEALDRSSGIRILNTTAVRVGDLVRITGKIKTSTGERVIMLPITVTYIVRGKPAPKPLCLNNRGIGGDSPNQYTLPVTPGVGLYNVGLLITTTGKVLSVNSTAKIFYIDDGSHRDDGTGNIGIQVACNALASGNSIPLPALNSYVKVTGIVTTQTPDGTNAIPTLRPRTSADVVSY